MIEDGAAQLSYGILDDETALPVTSSWEVTVTTW